MSLGVPEIILIVVIVLVLFAVTWGINSKRPPRRSGSTGASTQDKRDE